MIKVWINFGELSTGIILWIMFICLSMLSFYGNVTHFVLAGCLNSNWDVSCLSLKCIYYVDDGIVDMITIGVRKLCCINISLNDNYNVC